MALGIVSDDVFEAEVTKTPAVESIDVVTIESIKSPGRRPGDLEVPDSIRKIIGDTAVESGKQEATKMAEFFGLSKSSTSAYANGATSTATYQKSNADLKNHLVRTKERITRKAARGITRAFDNITDDKLAGATAPELASVIRAFSSVIKDMEVTDKGPDGPGVQFVFFTPPIRQEEAFEVIDSPT
jgi:hypothetical protein